MLHHTELGLYKDSRYPDLLLQGEKLFCVNWA